MKSFLKCMTIATLCLAPTLAYAQNASTMADARFHEGLAFVQAGQYEQARLAFAQAYAISKDPTTLWNLALAEMKTNHPVDAIRHFREFKRDPKANAQDIPTCTNLIARMEAETCHVVVKTTAGAEITVDGERWSEAAPTSDPIDVSEGVHTIRVQLGTRWASKDIDGVKGQEITITLDVGEAPQDHHDHVGGPVEHDKTVMFPPPTGAMILGGVGLVGLGLGVGFGLASSSSGSDAQALADKKACAVPTSPDCQSLQSKNDTAKTDGVIATVGYIGGGALLAGGIIWWLVAPRQEHVAVTPTVGRGSASLSLTGRF